MYAGLAQRGEDRQRERKRKRQERREERIELVERARTTYPELPRREAVTALRESEKAERETEAFVEDYAPIILAVGAGVVVMTFLRKKR